MYVQKKMILLVPAMLVILVSMTGCERADSKKMQEGLVQGGLTMEQAECYVMSLKREVPVKQFNYMAKLVSNGRSEKEAVKKTRLRYGSAEFRLAGKAARNQCLASE